MHINVINTEEKSNYKCEFSVVGHKDIITCLIYFKDENNKFYLVSSSLDNTLRIWDMGDKYKEIQKIEFNSQILDLCITDDNMFILVGTNNGCEIIKRNK